MLALDPKARTFLVTAVAMAFPAVEAGFQIGAYGEVFMSRKIASWSVVTAALVALALLPRVIVAQARSKSWREVWPRAPRLDWPCIFLDSGCPCLPACLPCFQPFS